MSEEANMPQEGEQKPQEQAPFEQKEQDTEAKEEESPEKRLAKELLEPQEDEGEDESAQETTSDDQKSESDKGESSKSDNEKTEDARKYSITDITREVDEESKGEEEEEEEEPAAETKIYVVKVTANQEKIVAKLMFDEAVVKRQKGKEQSDIYSIFYAPELKGYILVEADNPGTVEDLARGISHAKGLLLRKKGDLNTAGIITIDELEKILHPTPIVQKINKGDLVELVTGPFKGEKARVARIDSAKNQITVELIEAAVPIPVIVKGYDIRLLKNEDKDEGKESAEKREERLKVEREERRKNREKKKEEGEKSEESASSAKKDIPPKEATDAKKEKIADDGELGPESLDDDDPFGF